MLGAVFVEETQLDSCGHLREHRKVRAVPVPVRAEGQGFARAHVARLAADVMGVQLWVETHDSLSRGADMANLIRMVDRPNVGVCYNNLHPIRRGESLETTMAHLAGMIRHVHLHDGLNRPDKVIITPMGIGDMPIDDVILANGKDLRAYVLGVGGFLGVGERSVAVEPGSLTIQKQADGSERALVHATKENLEKAPALQRQARAQ